MARGRLAAERHHQPRKERIVSAARRIIAAARFPPTTRDIAKALREQGFTPHNLSSTLLKARGIIAANWRGHDRRGRYRWSLTPKKEQH